MVIEARPTGTRVAAERETGGAGDGGAGRDALLRAAFAAIRDLVIVLGPVRDAAGTIVDERIEFTNPAWRASLMGDANAPDPSGRMLLGAFPALGARLPTHVRVLESGEATRETVRLPDLTGHRWWDVEYVRLDDRLLVVSRDVTGDRLTRERLEASEAALRESEAAAHAGAESAELFRLAMTHASTGMAIVAPDGRYLEVNSALCAMLGRDAAALRASTWQALTHPDDMEASLALAAEIGEGRRDAYRQQKRYLRPDGSILWGDLMVAGVRDAAGSVACFVTQIIDVTERVEAEAAHRASEERYRTLVGELDGVVVVQDLANGTTFCSGQVQRLLGFPPETMVLPGAWLSLVVEEDVERVTASREGGDGRDGCELEYRMRRADGAVIWVAERLRSIRDGEGRLVRWSSVTTDVTSRKRLEETVTRTDRLEAVSRVAAAAAHDFGEVLTAIQYAQANLVAGLPADDPRAEDVRLIGDSVRHGVQLTRQLLAFSRDRDELEPAPIDVAWLLADLEQILRGVAGTAALGIRVNASGLTRIVRSALEQAVLNLVINARDAMPTGGSIRITLDREQVVADTGLGVPAGPYLALAVSDTGSGMPVEVAERAFEPFFTTKPHGSGLGLPMVYGAMRSIGGTVRIASRPGEGTTVSLLMPEAEPVAQVAPIG